LVAGGSTIVDSAGVPEDYRNHQENISLQQSDTRF
jgi:hypothetical protein